MLATTRRVFNFVGLGKAAVLLAAGVVVAGALYADAAGLFWRNSAIGDGGLAGVLAAVLGLAAWRAWRGTAALAMAVGLALALDAMALLGFFALFEVNAGPSAFAVALAVVGGSWWAKQRLFALIVAALNGHQPGSPLSLSRLANCSAVELLQRWRYGMLAALLVAGTLGAGPLSPAEAGALVAGLLTATVSTLCIAPAIWLTLQQRHMPTVVPTRYRAALNSTPFLAALLVLLMLGVSGWLWLPAHGADSLAPQFASHAR